MDNRQLSLICLIKILDKNQSADDVLNKNLQQTQYPSELYNLVAGAVKNKLKLDFFISQLSSKKLEKLSYPVKNILRLAVYELEYTETPAYAVIDSYVNLVKKYEKKASGFINAVLRNFIRQKDNIKPPNINDKTVQNISINYSHPQWMVEKWIKLYGLEDTINICKYNNSIPSITIRINTLKISLEELIDIFDKQNIEYSKSEYPEECLNIKHKGNITELPGFKEGYWIVQGESSCLVSKVLSPEEDSKILDLCAAPGGKTTHLACLIKNKGSIKAIDINKSRIKKIQENCERLGVSCVELEAADGSIYHTEEKFDYILIDAPCSNTGVLSKRMDARWNKSQQDIENLSTLQYKILDNAKNLLAPNGILVYSTCSIEPEENVQVVDKFIANNSDFIIDDINNYLPDKLKSKEKYLQILPSRYNIDGFFICRLKIKINK